MVLGTANGTFFTGQLARTTIEIPCAKTSPPGPSWLAAARATAGGVVAVRQRLRPAVSSPALVDRVWAHYGLTEADVRRKGRSPSIVEACGLVCYVGVRKLGCQTSGMAKLLRMARPE